MGCPASEFVDILHPMLAFDLNQRAMVKWNFRFMAILQKDYCYFQDCVILALPRFAKKILIYHGDLVHYCKMTIPITEK